MAHLTPSALHFKGPIPDNIAEVTSECCDFFRNNHPSKWLAEEYIKVDSSFDTYLATIGRLSKQKGPIASVCFKLHRHYASSIGLQQLELLKQQAATRFSKEIVKSSTHQVVYNEIHGDNKKRHLEDSIVEHESPSLYTPIHSSSHDPSPPLYTPTQPSSQDSSLSLYSSTSDSVPPPPQRVRLDASVVAGQSLHFSPTANSVQCLLSSDPADGSYIDREEEYEPEIKMFVHDFLDGDGRRDSNVQDQWVHCDIEVGKALLAFRDRMVENNFGLSQPHEKLALNFIFLVDSEFQTGGLQGEVDDDVWAALWQSIGQLNVPAFASEVVVEAHNWAHLAATHGYDEFVQIFEDAPPASRLLKQVLTRLTSTRELWAQEEENEATFLKNMLAPCLDACFDDTRDARSRLLIPDYSVSTLVGSQSCSVVHLEGKTTKNGGYSQIWDDRTKLGQELKYSLDSMIKLQPQQAVCSQGILVQGSQLEFYHMSLKSEGIYLMRRYAKCFLCTGSNNMFPLVRILEAMQATKD
ncbi:hypothetical protein BGZ51_003044 [Haplosporangium sp. Z 767]|nr:hypothetical protein BGZ51_003044 [Haplosporangium sp. Z 767]